MEDIKTTYTVAGKEFDTYEAAIAYKKELDSKDKNKHHINLKANLGRPVQFSLIIANEQFHF